ncbi:MAG: hypothetical protein MN733_10460 [Nitrososphaera sp.]|nr:hypothetical protein [Nitrososphaera sp.]
MYIEKLTDGYTAENGYLVSESGYYVKRNEYIINGPFDTESDAQAYIDELMDDGYSAARYDY